MFPLFSFSPKAHDCTGATKIFSKTNKTKQNEQKKTNKTNKIIQPVNQILLFFFVCLLVCLFFFLYFRFA